MAIHTNSGCSSSGGSNIGKKIYPETLAHRLPEIAHVQANNTEAIHATPDVVEALVRPNDQCAIHATSNETPNVVEALVRANDRQAVVHATTDGSPNVVEALVQANLGSADDSEPDAAPNDSDAHVQAILG